MIRLLAGTAIAALAAASASPAAASVTITSTSGSDGFHSGQIFYTPGGIVGSPGNTAQNLSIGRIKMAGFDNSTMAAVTFDTYCIDIFHWAQSGTFDLQAFTLPDPDKRAEVMKLLGHTANFIASADAPANKKKVSAAIQMAVWEIVNETAPGAYSLGGGVFGVSSTYGSVVNSGARTLAQSYLDNLAGWADPTGYNYRMMTAITPTNNQRQVLLAAVPEPSTWALFILGFGVIGGALRARRRTAIAFA